MELNKYFKTNSDFGHFILHLYSRKERELALRISKVPAFYRNFSLLLGLQEGRCDLSDYGSTGVESRTLFFDSPMRIIDYDGVTFV